ncbi:TMEM164 family acyltransferase [Romboutsia sp.]|uniref:TMEM164 family acyltransferase n=1 Tax=Romboutsia sp. TaxID=1965302 RepID=UPI003F2F3642
MTNTFLFSKEHLIIILMFAIFIYFCPKLTKNLLPYSYIVEKIICGLLILEIVFEQVSIASMGNYNVFTCLPIEIGRFTAYLCIAILFFKQYHLFNVFFSWSLVCSIGEIIFFKYMPYRFPNVLYFFAIISKCLLVYATVYMVEVRKFKVSKSAIKDNLLMCLAYFTFIVALNFITSSYYNYSFSNQNIFSIAIFILLTTIIYIPIFIFDKDKGEFKLKNKNK